MSRKVVTDIYQFMGGGIIPATVVSNGPWKKTITGIGPPTCALSGGSALLALEATSEVQNVCLDFGNALCYDVDDLVAARFWVHTPVAIGDDVKARFGFAGNRNDDPDAVAQSLFFGVNGSADLIVESDGAAAANEVAATATGVVLGTAVKLCEFDFKSGTYAQAPPAVSQGGKHQIVASVQDVNGSKRRVATGVRLNLSDYSGSLQLLAQIQKTAATDVGSLGIKRIEVERYE